MRLTSLLLNPSDKANVPPVEGYAPAGFGQPYSTALVRSALEFFIEQYVFSSEPVGRRLAITFCGEAAEYIVDLSRDLRGLLAKYESQRIEFEISCRSNMVKFGTAEMDLCEELGMSIEPMLGPFGDFSKAADKIASNLAEARKRKLCRIARAVIPHALSAEFANVWRLLRESGAECVFVAPFVDQSWDGGDTSAYAGFLEVSTDDWISDLERGEWTWTRLLAGAMRIGWARGHSRKMCAAFSGQVFCDTLGNLWPCEWFNGSPNSSPLCLGTVWRRSKAEKPNYFLHRGPLPPGIRREAAMYADFLAGTTCEPYGCDECKIRRFCPPKCLCEVADAGMTDENWCRIAEIERNAAIALGKRCGGNGLFVSKMDEISVSGRFCSECILS